MSETINIYRLLNNFNHLFGYQPEIRLSMVDRQNIFLKMVYDKNVNIPNDDPDAWSGFDINNGTNTAMVRIHITRNSQTKEPELLLWNDDIYTNSYIWRSYSKAKQLYETILKFRDLNAQSLFHCYHITLGNRLLKKAIAKYEDKIKNYQTYFIPKTSDFDELKKYAGALQDAIDGLEMLREIQEKQNKKA